jgi:hypothetical protein
MVSPPPPPPMLVSQAVRIKKRGKLQRKSEIRPNLARFLLGGRLSENSVIVVYIEPFPKPHEIRKNARA